MSLMEGFSNLLSRNPNAERDLGALLDNAARARERVADDERSRLRRERGRILDDLAIGRAALLAGVREAEIEVARAEEALRVARRKRATAIQELRSFEVPIMHRLGRIESEIARRPISFLAPLRQKLALARKALGAPPSWAMDRHASAGSWYARADSLGRIEKEIRELEETNSTRVERDTPALVRAIENAIRG